MLRPTQPATNWKAKWVPGCCNSRPTVPGKMLWKLGKRAGRYWSYSKLQNGGIAILDSVILKLSADFHICRRPFLHGKKFSIVAWTVFKVIVLCNFFVRWITADAVVLDEALTDRQTDKLITHLILILSITLCYKTCNIIDTIMWRLVIVQTGIRVSQRRIKCWSSQVKQQKSQLAFVKYTSINTFFMLRNLKGGRPSDP